jgi:hypothetical protein
MWVLIRISNMWLRVSVNVSFICKLLFLMSLYCAELWLLLFYV